MKSLIAEYPDGRSHPIVFDALEHLPAHMETVDLVPGRCLIVTDKNVAALLVGDLELVMTPAGWHVSAYVVEPGESSKSVNTLQQLFDFALAARVDRDTPLIALGGGVVGDLAGFCASTLLRGIPLIHVPTTLVSQVDSSIGGKTGVNHAAGKNLIGSFYQPRLVLADARTLQTLPDREWRSGMAEVVKHAMLTGSDFVVEMTDRWEGLASRDPLTVAEIIPRSAAIKIDIVTADETEAGRRAVLNLGHTVGHAIERTAGYGQLSHGEAVAAGLAIALRISDAVFPDDDRRVAWTLLRRLGWPSVAHLPVDDIVSAVGYDKKKRAGTLRFVLLRSPGHPEIRSDVPLDAIRDAWSWLTQQGEGQLRH